MARGSSLERGGRMDCGAQARAPSTGYADLLRAVKEEHGCGSGCGFQAQHPGTWADDVRLDGLSNQEAAPGRGPEQGFFMLMHKELRILEDKFARQLRRVQEHSERCTDVLLRPLELKMTSLASRQKAVDGQLAAHAGDIRGLQDALATHVRGRETADAQLEQWTKTVESDLRMRCTTSKQELAAVLNAGLRDRVTRQDLLEVTDLLKAELPKLAVDFVPWGTHEDIIRTFRQGPGNEAKAAGCGAAVKKDLQETAGMLREELRLLSDQASAEENSSKASVIWELQKATEANRRGLAELTQRTEQGERALAEVRGELLRVQEDVGRLWAQSLCRPRAAVGEEREFRDLAESSAAAASRLATEVAEERRRVGALAARLAAVEEGQAAAEERQGLGGCSPEAGARRRVARLLERAEAAGHGGLGHWLESLGQRMALLEDTISSGSAPKACDQMPRTCGHAAEAEASLHGTAATEEPRATEAFGDPSSALSEAAVLADNLAEELHVARLATEEGGGELAATEQGQTPGELDIRNQVAAVWCGLAELADVMSVSCNSLAASAAADRTCRSAESAASCRFFESSASGLLAE